MRRSMDRNDQFEALVGALVGIVCSVIAIIIFGLNPHDPATQLWDGILLFGGCISLLLTGYGLCYTTMWKMAFWPTISGLLITVACLCFTDVWTSGNRIEVSGKAGIICLIAGIILQVPFLITWIAYVRNVREPSRPPAYL
jgi:hypothetical protein